MSFTRVDVPEHTTLRFDGSLDVLNAPELHGVILELCAEEPRHVTLDLSHLDLIDGSGVGAVVSLCKRLREKGVEVCVEGASGQPLAIFKLLGLGRFLELREPPPAEHGATA